MKSLSMLIGLVLCLNAAASDLEALWDWVYATPEGQLCDQRENPVPLDSQIERFEWSTTTAWSDEPVPYVFYTFLCNAAAYNFSFLMIEEARYPEGAYHIVSFAVPVVDFEMEAESDEASTEVVKAWSLTGFSSTDQLVNVYVNSEMQTLEHFNKARGIGDAFDLYRYRFKEGSWLLVYAEQDPTYDGELNPITVFEP